MNGSDSEVEWFTHWDRFGPSEENMNSSVIIIINTTSFTGSSTLFSPPIRIDIDLNNCNQEDIERLLEDELTDHVWLCSILASYISTTATDLGFRCNGYIVVNITYRTVVVLSEPSSSNNNDESAISQKDKILKMVLEGKLDREELRSSKMVETEVCSICLDNLFDSSKHGDFTRMICSHIFHEHCLLNWLHRNSSCPLCRIVLYNQ